MKIALFPVLVGVFSLAPNASAQAGLSPLSPQVAAPAAAASPTVSPDTVVAEVDGKKYTAKDVDQLLALYPPQMQANVRTDPKRAFGLLLLMRELADAAEKASLDKQSPLKEQLEYSRLSVLSQAQINQVRNAEVKVEPDDEQKFYKEHPERFQEAKVKVIYVAFVAATAKSADPTKKSLTEAEAKAKIEDLRKQILAGADFATMAKDHSDDKESAPKGGDFPPIKLGSPYPESIKSVVFSLKPGAVSDPVRQPNGFYLLKLEAVTKQPYNEVRTQIYDELKQKGFNEWMQSTQKRYEVKVESPAYFVPKNGSPVSPQNRQ